MAGVLLLAPKYGAISQAVYVLLGLVGLPIFTMGGGFSYVLQPSFGFLVGLIPSAWVIGTLCKNAKSFWPMALGILAGLAVLYLIGTPYMGLILNLYLGKGMSVWQIVRAGCLLYLPGRRAEDRGLHGALPRAAQPSAEGPCGGLSQGTPCCLDFPTFSLDCQPFCGCSPLSILPYRPKPGTTVPGFCALWRNLA